MKKKVITDNTKETITVRWDGERFAIISLVKIDGAYRRNTIILNPKEMLDMVNFAGVLEKEV